MSREKPAKGDDVEVVLPHTPEDGWVQATVEAPLSSQFTVLTKDGSTFFYFDADREKYSGQVGATWRPAS